VNFFNQYYLLKKHHNIADSINKTIEIKNQHVSVNPLEFEVDKFKKVQIEVDSLIYVEAMGNYLNIAYECNGIKKITIRETINNIEQKTSPSGMIYRSHRSYLVNLHHISNVTGDAQGLKIYLKDIDIAIPVSRNKIREFRSMTSSRM
jgi:DNA-binding LytR/AlgR family response regulator